MVSVAQVVTRSVSNPKHILKNKHLSMASIKKLILLKGDTFVESTTYVEFTYKSVTLEGIQAVLGISDWIFEKWNLICKIQLLN